MKELQSPSSVYSFDFANLPWYSNILHQVSRRRSIRQITIVFLSIVLFSWTWMCFSPATIPSAKDSLIVHPSQQVTFEGQSGIQGTVGEGVDLNTLLNMSRTSSSRNETVSIVVVSGPNTLEQLNVIRQDSSDVFRDNRTNIYLLTDPDDEQGQQFKDIGIRVHPVPLGASLDHVPLLVGSNLIQSDYVWILEPNALPGKHYFEWVYSLAHAEPYSNAVLGTHAMLLPANVFHDSPNSPDPVCLDASNSTTTQAVDMVLGAWFVRRAWLEELLFDNGQEDHGAPLAFRLGQRHQAIMIPVHPDTAYQLRYTQCQDMIAYYHQHNTGWRRTLSHHVTPTRLDWVTMAMPEHRLVFWADDADRLEALFPLIDRFKAVSGVKVHVVYVRSQEDEKVHWPHDAGMLHILSPTTPQSRKKKLIEALAPRVVIHAKDPSSADPVLLGQQQQRDDTPTVISLPVEDIPHALWIADLSLEALAQWNTVKIELVVITDKRPQSLGRLFHSLRQSMYLGDSVDLTIHMEQTADSVTRRVTQSLAWDHGIKTVRHRIRKGGLMPAIVESWYPSSNDDYAVILEDDIEVSRLFYVWAKYAILRYKYVDKAIGGHPELFGVSLYSPRHLELLPEGRRPFNPSDFIKDHSPYLTPVPCSWGAVYFPEHWREFHSYLIGRLDMPSGANVSVPESRSNRWKKSWKKYFIELAYLRSYVMLYPNFEHFESFSTNHLEIGTHVKDGGRPQNKIDEFLVPLMDSDTILAQLPQSKLPDFSALPVLDLWGNPTSLDRLEATAAAWHPKVSTCDRNRPGMFDPSDLLCPYPSSKKKTASSKGSHTTAKPVDSLWTGQQPSSGSDAESLKKREGLRQPDTILVN